MCCKNYRTIQTVPRLIMSTRGSTNKPKVHGAALCQKNLETSVLARLLCLHGVHKESVPLPLPIFILLGASFPQYNVLLASVGQNSVSISVDHIRAACPANSYILMACIGKSNFYVSLLVTNTQVSHSALTYILNSYLLTAHLLTSYIFIYLFTYFLLT